MLPIFSHLHMGEVVQRGPQDWLQSREITKQMDMEQISINLPRERINQVKMALCVCVRARTRLPALCGGESGGQLVLLLSLQVLILQCLFSCSAVKDVCWQFTHLISIDYETPGQKKKHIPHFEQVHVYCTCEMFKVLNLFFVFLLQGTKLPVPPSHLLLLDKIVCENNK